MIAQHAPHVVFLTSPNNPTGIVEPADRVAELLEMAPGIVVADEAYAQFADWSALELVDEQRPLVVTRTFSKTWSMAAVRLGYVIAPTWFVSALEGVVLPYHLDAAKQIAGRLALRFVDEMDERVRLDRVRARTPQRSDASDADRRHPQRSQLHPVPAADCSGARRLAGARRPQRART